MTVVLRQRKDLDALLVLGGSGEGYHIEALKLVVIDEDEIFHAFDPNIYDNNLNMDHQKHSRSGIDPVTGELKIGFEDLWGGGDKDNWQNFPRPDPKKPEKGALRRAIKAP